MRLPYWIWIGLHSNLIVWVHSTTCGNVFREEKGVITSPGFPQSYRKNLYCVNTIHLKAGKLVRLQWDRFSVPGHMPHCGGDYVRITRCTPPYVHLIRYCGEQLPSAIYSYEKCLRIEFRSTNYVSMRKRNTPRHFRVRYQTIDASTSIPYSSNCLAVRTTNLDNTTEVSQSNSKLIFTPGWPLSYSGRVPNNGCQERIVLGGRKRAKILFMGLDLYTPVKEQPCHQLKNDVLIVRGVTEKEETFSYVYCGKRDPFSVYYRHPFKYLDFIFVSGSSRHHNHKGFVLGVLIFNDNRTDERAFSVPLIPTLVSFGVICLLMFCFMQTMKTCCHRNIVQHTSRRRGGSGGPLRLPPPNDITMDTHGNNNIPHIPHPPPYSLTDHVTNDHIRQSILGGGPLIPVPPYEASEIRTPPPPYRRDRDPLPPPYGDDSDNEDSVRRVSIVAGEDNAVAAGATGGSQKVDEH